MLWLLLVSKWKWDEIVVDFVVGLPRAPLGEDAIWVVVDRLTKTAHFILMKVKDYIDQLARFYVQYILRLQGVPTTIVLDHDPRFTSKFAAGDGDTIEV